MGAQTCQRGLTGVEVKFPISNAPKVKYSKLKCARLGLELLRQMAAKDMCAVASTAMRRDTMGYDGSPALVLQT